MAREPSMYLIQNLLVICCSASERARTVHSAGRLIALVIPALHPSSARVARLCGILAVSSVLWLDITLCYGLCGPNMQARRLISQRVGAQLSEKRQIQIEHKINCVSLNVAPDTYRFLL